VRREHGGGGERQVGLETEPPHEDEEDPHRGEVEEDVRQVVTRRAGARPLGVDHVRRRDERAVVVRGAVRSEEGLAECRGQIGERPHESGVIDELDRVVGPREAERHRAPV
jgi:hypothetical protein